jgi:hypothetical protein
MDEHEQKAVLITAARRPRVRYPVGTDARKLVAVPGFLPDRLLDQLRLRALGLRTKFGSEAAGPDESTRGT